MEKLQVAEKESIFHSINKHLLSVLYEPSTDKENLHKIS